MSLLLVTACSTNVKPLAPRYATPSTISQTLQPFDEKSIASLQELGTLLPQSDTSNIKILLPATGTNTLFAAYADGYLRKWNIDTRQEISRIEVGLVADQATSFSSDGRHFITPSAIVTQAVESNFDVFPAVESIYLWDTQTGQQVDCFGFTCDPTRKPYRSLTRGAVLSPDGQWLVEYAADGLSFDDLWGQRPSVVSMLEDPDHRTYRHIGRVAFDPSGVYYAVAYDEGQLELYDFADAVLNGNSGTRVSTFGESDGISLPVQSLIIDDTRSWLATLRGNDISVWSLQARPSKQISYNLLSGNASLAFDRNGRLLFIGADSILVVLDLASGLVLAQYRTAEISAVSVSLDNRVLFWGDAGGVVHIWGSPSL